MAGRRTAAFGRVLSTLGWMWMLAAIITAFIGMRGQGVPFLPGIVIYLLGRTMSVLGKRGDAEERAAAATTEPTASMEPPPAPEPPREERPVRQRNEYLEERREPEPEEVFEIPDLEDAILEAPPPMTSEEMVAEARRRFGPRPIEEED